MRRLTDAPSLSLDAELLAGVACALAVVLVGVALWLRASAGAFDFTVQAVVRPKVALRAAHDSMAITYTFDGGMIRWYVLVDPETRVQYLVNDREGSCVRVGWDGESMGAGSDWGDW